MENKQEEEGKQSDIEGGEDAWWETVKDQRKRDNV